jgi:hypothetical protein
MGNKKQMGYKMGRKVRSTYYMGGGYQRNMMAEGGKAYSSIRDMEKACMSPDHNESMKEK